MNKLIAFLAIFYFLLFAAVKVFGHVQFELLDTDKNGTISIKEAKNNLKLRSQFLELDSNTDGVLSKNEFTNYADQYNAFSALGLTLQYPSLLIRQMQG